MRPFRHYAPGSLSQGSNLQEVCSPGTARRRVVPWGTVSSRSKEPMELFLSPRKVFVSSTPPRPAHTVYGPPPRWQPEDRDDADVFSLRFERTSATRHPGGSPTKKP